MLLRTKALRISVILLASSSEAFQDGGIRLRTFSSHKSLDHRFNHSLAQGIVDFRRLWHESEKKTYPYQSSLLLSNDDNGVEPEELATSRFESLYRALKYPYRKMRDLWQIIGGENEPEIKEKESDIDKTVRKLEADVVEAEKLPGAVDNAGMTRRQPGQPDGDDLPVSDRTATAGPQVNLSGKWNLIVSDEFKEQYDRYLTLLGQPLIVRSVALSIVGYTSEETTQKEQGRELVIRGRNVRGIWERTLIASGADEEPVLVTIQTADDEQVQAESWWENGGRTHRSWLRGIKKYGGGSFESRRFLENNGKILVCESTFHPDDKTREYASVTWRFQREDVK